MKAVLSFLTIIFLTNPIFAQTNKIDQIFKGNTFAKANNYGDLAKTNQTNTHFIDSLEYQEIYFGSIEFVSKVAIEYDSLNRIKSFETKYGNHPDSLIVGFRGSYHYTFNSLYDSSVSYDVDSSGMISRSTKSISHGGFPLPDSTKMFYWNDSLNDWEINERNILYYSGSLDSVYYTYYSNDTSYSNQIDKYYYNSQQNLEKMIEGYNYYGPWRPNYGTEYFYNSTGTRYDSLVRGSTDSLGNIGSTIRTHITYDSNNNPFVVERDPSFFGSGYRSEISFRTDLLKSQTGPGWLLDQVAPYGYEFASNPVDIDSSYDYDNGTWILEGVYKYYYSERQPVSIKSFDSFGGLKIYPNPVQDQLNIEFDNDLMEAEIALYDLQGRLQMQRQLFSKRSTLSISELPQGLFIYEIRNGDQFQRGKILKD